MKFGFHPWTLKSSFLHMNFAPKLTLFKRIKFMCKNKLFQNLGTKNELFKIQGQKTNFI